MTLVCRETWNPKLKALYENLKCDGYYSQHNEAEIIKRIFEICKPKNKWCVEFGADKGKNLSNVYYFIAKMGWNGVLIEVRSEQFRGLVENYKGIEKVQLFMKMIRPRVITNNGTFTDGNDIESFLDCYTKAPKDLDFMSIDIDSHDYEVWRGMEKYKPNIMCIEINPQEDDMDVLWYDPSWSVKTDENRWYGGATIGLMNKLAEEKGYYFVYAEVCNAIYIRKDFAEPLLL